MQITKTRLLCPFLGVLRHGTSKNCLEKKNKAFSLVELLVALIIISVITAALAPTITKKAAKASIMLGNLTSVLKDQYEGVLLNLDVENPNCTVQADGTAKCSVTIPDGVTKVNAIVVGGGGGGGGASAYSQTEGSYSRTTAGSQTFNIGSDAVDVKIKSMTAGGGGGGGGTITNMNKSIAKTLAGCNAWAEEIKTRIGSRPDIYFLANQCIFITYGDVYYDTKNIHEVCRNDNPVWQDSADDAWSLASSEWVTTYVIPNARKRDYYDQYVLKNKQCLWRDDTDVTANYTQETRDKYECINGWNATTKQCDGLTAYDLYSETYISRDAGYGKGRWKTLYANTDDEDTTWVPAGPKVYYNYFYQYEKLNANNDATACTNNYKYAGWRQAGENYGYVEDGIKIIGNVPTGPHMAVCYFSGSIVDKNYYGGGGGGGGTYVEDIEIPSYVVSNSNGQITLTAGGGGNGGDGGKIEYKYYPCDKDPCNMALADNKYFYGKNGTDGGTSSVSIGGWTYSIAGGKGGYAKTGLNASFSARGGEGGQCAKDYSKCFDGNIGNNPEAKATDTYITAKFEGSYGGGGGSSLSRTTAGKGGYGGDAGKYTDNDYVDVYTSGIDYGAAKGSDGTAGNVYITYAHKIRAGGGGGGGGAGYAFVQNISVTPNTTYSNIVIGNGGTGGSIGEKGADGKNSSFTIGSTTCSANGGKGGNFGSKAASATAMPTHGTGGAAGGISCTSASKYATGKAGGTGAQSGTSGEHGSQGGCGGDSGIGAQGGHGGNNYSRGHKNALVNGLTTVFEAPSILIAKILLGSAGAGGGGGGWSNAVGNYSTPGVGGDGQDGYVYIYWKKKGN